MIESARLLLRELLFWAPSAVDLDLSGALVGGIDAAPIDLRFAARRAGAFCLAGPVHSLRRDGMQGSGQLLWCGGDAQLWLCLSEAGGAFRCWVGSLGSVPGGAFPAGAEFTGGWHADGYAELILRLDYRVILARVASGRLCAMGGTRRPAAAGNAAASCFF